jgi:sec-independent protein translocase protein TatC
MGHLTELRKRLTWSAAVVVVAVIACFIFRNDIFAILRYPLHGTKYRDITGGQDWYAFSVGEPFMAALKVSIYAGLLCALPFLLYQFWAFILPGLYEREKKSVMPYMALSTGLFLGGVVFGYMVVLPIGLKWLVGFASGQFKLILHVDAYVTFISMFLLAFGAVFELPMIMMLLAWAGIVDYKKMTKWRKYAVLMNAVIAMVITPSQDPISMILMLIPLLILYEFGILLSRLVYKRRERRRQERALEAMGRADGDGDDQHLSEATVTSP